MKKKFETHSYDAQRHMYGALCKMLTTQIKSSEEHVKKLDHGYGEWSDECDRICLKVKKLLENTSIDKDRRSKILLYLQNAMRAVRTKNRIMNELDEKKRGMRSSKERDEISNQSKELFSQITNVIDCTQFIEHALKDVQSQDITWWDDNSEVGIYCGALDYQRKNAVKNMERMTSIIEKRTMLKRRENETRQTKQLNSQVSEIKLRLKKTGKIIDGLKMGGIENKQIEKLDSEISKAESYLRQIE